MSEVLGKEKILFNRIEFLCPICKQDGVFTAVWLSLSRVILEGYCGHCDEIWQRSLDLLKTDAWLRGEADLPDYGIEAVIVPTVAAPSAEGGCGNYGGRESTKRLKIPSMIHRNIR